MLSLCDVLFFAAETETAEMEAELVVADDDDAALLVRLVPLSSPLSALSEAILVIKPGMIEMGGRK